MTIKLTPQEQAFLKRGGHLWCVREGTAGWEAVKLRSDGEIVAGARSSREEASIDALSLANLSEDKSNLAVHHAIPRPDDWPPDYLRVK